MSNRSIVTLAVLLTGSLFIDSCKHDPLEFVTPTDDNGGNNGWNNTPCDPDSVYFQNSVLPLLTTNCTMSGCHDAASNQDGVTLTSYQSVMNSGIIDPGNASNSDLFDVITETDPDKIMPPPPYSPLSPSQITTINNWINQGANNNSCTSGCDTTNVTYSGSIAPLLSAKCTGCHGSINPQGNINLTTYTNVYSLATSGTLYGAVDHQPNYARMPPSGSKLPQCELDMIRIWIQNGAPNN